MSPVPRIIVESTAASECLEIRWSWQRKPHIEAQRAMWHRRKRALSRVWLFRFVLALTALMVGYALFEAVIGAILFAAGVGIMGTVGGVIGQRVQWFIQARQFEKRCLPKYESVLYVVDSTGLRIRNSDIDLHHGWSAFERWSEADDFVLLFTGPAVGYYIPKAALTPETLPAFRRILDSHLTRQPDSKRDGK